MPEHYRTSDEPDGTLVIYFVGQMNLSNASSMLDSLTRMIKKKAPLKVTADLSQVSSFDDYGSLVLFELRHILISGNKRFLIANSNRQIQDILKRTGFDLHDQVELPPKKRMYNIAVRLGQQCIQEGANARFILIFIGSVFIGMAHVMIRPGKLRFDDTITNMEKTGVDALPIVALISLLLGLIMAFMASIQFRQFGAGIYVADMVAYAMVSELGPIMTAIIVAGRSGSAYAAEISAMKIAEEIDALFTMGFDPVLFLAVPRVIAALITVPVLTMFSSLFAITGGLLVGVFMLDLTPKTYINETLMVLTLSEVLWGAGKSALFALLISMTGCLRGFQAKGGPSAVGSAATSAVVTGIFLIILFDSIFAVIRSYWG